MKIKYEDYKFIEKAMIKKLYSAKCWNNGHMLIERFKSGLPPHLKGDVKNVLKDLLKKDIIIFYGKTKHGDAYQLNIKKLKEIEEIIFDKV